ncbi:MAG: RidA family protein [Clostridiales bacterium]|jgi:enamine deaminase RidA (YjgF/YER057c/UK114 family)|nr:RidA family protein [Clostridiales bacterium]
MYVSKVEDKLRKLGIDLPDVPEPVAAYVPAVRAGALIFTSGQLPIQNGVLKKGRLGENTTVAEGYEAAKICAINCIAAIKSMVGDLDRVEQVVKVTGFVNSTPDFYDHPKVINGASELMREVFGGAGAHSRSALGVSALPLGGVCEVEAIVRVKP